ncbi:MAG: carbonic anhydrase [Phycisphaerae bacterium]|nr:carbonic anhydrase [Phycisphaerae bacterium]
MKHVFMLFVSGVAVVAPGSLLHGGEPTAGAPRPDEVMRLLQAGNARFSGGQPAHPRVGPERRMETVTAGQHPIATIVSCSDSRVPVELIFDEGIGDLFVIRVAGNVCGTDETGSIEYGIEHLGTPLLVVMGHRECGAVTAVCRQTHTEGSIPMLLAHIRPAVERTRVRRPELRGPDLVNAAIRENVWHGIEDVLTHSEIARGRVASGKLMIVGAIYDLRTARVAWLGVHPEQARFLAAASSDAATQPAGP